MRAWNRTRCKAEPLSEDGAEVFDSPAEAAAQSSVILTMLADANAVLRSAKASDEHYRRARHRALHREMAREHGAAFLDAPVLGTKQPAQEGRLVVMAAGDPDLRERVQPVFDAIGQKTIWLAEKPGAATRLNIATNSWLLTVTEGCAETIALTQGLGRSIAAARSVRSRHARPPLLPDQGQCHPRAKVPRCSACRSPARTHDWSRSPRPHTASTSPYLKRSASG